MLNLIFISGLGLVIGSFVNAVVWRLHERTTTNNKTKIDADDLSITRGRSMCPQCRHRLFALDLIPILGWLILKGRCRYCQKPISVRYPIVELLTASLFGLSYIVLQPVSLLAWTEFGFWLYFLTVLIMLALYDLYWYILPDVILLPAIVVGFIYAVVQGVASGSVGVTLGLLLPALAAGGSFYTLAAVSKGRWMGGGDIKLVFFMGLILGWSKVGLALMLAFNAGAIIGVILIALKIKHRKDHIPFGPFLVGGTIVAVLYGNAVIEWYLRLMGYA